MSEPNNKLQKLMPDAPESQVYESIRAALADARTHAFSVINSAMVAAYWEIGREIAEAVGDRAEYGKQLLQFFSEKLTAEFGKGFTIANLRNMRQFYQMFPNRYALRSELTWTHYRMLMRVEEQNRRDFYLNESVKNEIQQLEPKTTADYILKDPYILEFLDLGENKSYHESELEQALIDKLQEFLLELGKGFSFVARQRRVTTEGGEHYYIDLVFYNFILKCFVVIDLKAGKLTYQDVGQIDFYVRLFNEKVKLPDDNPTIGIVLCADKDESIVKYSVLADNENLFASKYRLYLPTEEELKAELERERELIERKMAEDEE